jgi:hypothetical protein
MGGHLTRERIQEGDDVRHVVIAQGFPELEARHHTHGIIQLGH